MKKLLILLATLPVATAFAQATNPSADASFDGNYERREWRTKDRPMLDSDLTIKGKTGSFHQFSMKKSKTDNCAGRTVPIEVLNTEGNKITFTVKLSQIMPQCNDFTATFQSVSSNGKSGLGLPNTGEVMFVKR
jgi:hypothetical protein